MFSTGVGLVLKGFERKEYLNSIKIKKKPDDSEPVPDPGDNGILEKIKDWFTEDI